MSIVIYITLLVVMSTIILIFYLVKKNNLKKEIVNVNKNIENENNQFVKMMTKIINDDSFRIIKKYNNFQIIIFNYILFDFGNLNWKKLPKDKLHWLVKFYFFLLEDNRKYPIIMMERDEYLVILKNDDGTFTTIFLDKKQLEKHLKNIHKDFSELNKK